jgi:hypothetical protein
MTKYTENEGPYEALTPENAALLLIDHQVGLLQLVVTPHLKSLETTRWAGKNRQII